jgi:hypothetical protein
MRGSPRLELRRGARVRWHSAQADRWIEGKLLRPSPTNEEWLVKADTGQQYWIFVTSLQPA